MTTRVGRLPIDAHELLRAWLVQRGTPGQIAAYNSHVVGSDDPGGVSTFPASKGIRIG
jgi:hypothetical protein